jgi:hypothetical protein
VYVAKKRQITPFGKKIYMRCIESVESVAPVRFKILGGESPDRANAELKGARLERGNQTLEIVGVHKEAHKIGNQCSAKFTGKKQNWQPNLEKYAPWDMNICELSVKYSGDS